MRIKIELEFDEEILGQKWMNPDNLELLLYSKEATKKELSSSDYLGDYYGICEDGCQDD